MLGERIFLDRFDGREPIGVALFRQPADAGWVSMGLLVRLFAMRRGLTDRNRQNPTRFHCTSSAAPSRSRRISSVPSLPDTQAAITGLSRVRLGCDADHLRRTAAEVLPHLGNVHPSHPVMLAGGRSGLLPGRFSLRRKIKTLTHRLTVARGCKSKRNEQSVDLRAEILAAEAKNNAQEQCASSSAARPEASEALQLQIVFP
jgi:hypothetical protein